MHLDIISLTIAAPNKYQLNLLSLHSHSNLIHDQQMKICCAIKWHAELYCHSHKFGLLIKYATCPFRLTHRLPFLPGMHFILDHCEYTWYMNVMNLYAWLWWSTLDIKMGNTAFYIWGSSIKVKPDIVIIEWGEIYKQSPPCLTHMT